MSRAVRTIEVVSQAFPGGVGFQPPTAEVPYWRDVEGNCYSFPRVAARARGELRARLKEAQLAAVGELLEAASAAEEEGEAKAKRRLISEARRLCEEFLQSWPSEVKIRSRAA